MKKIKEKRKVEKTNRSTTGNGTLEELVESLKDAELSIGESQTEVKEEQKGVTEIEDVKSKVDIDLIRGELIKSSENGEINQSVKYLKKASARVIEKIHKQFETDRLQKVSAIITDTLLSTFASTLGEHGRSRKQRRPKRRPPKERFTKKRRRKDSQLHSTYTTLLRYNIRSTNNRKARIQTQHLLHPNRRYNKREVRQ